MSEKSGTQPKAVPGAVLVIEDGRLQREILAEILRGEGHEVISAGSGNEAKEKFREAAKTDVILTDLKMPGMDGIGVIRWAKGVNPAVQVIVITAYGTIESAVESMKLGAYDYLTKPIQKEEVKMVVRKALEDQRLKSEVTYLRQELRERYNLNNVVGTSPKMQEIYKIVQKVAGGDATVMIYGASGTGKELIARAIHYNSPRKHKLFVPIDCASFPETLLESELFGYEKGAFTGASARKIGLFEQANEGTLFLDEIADLSLNTQAKLLRALQEREIKRVGGVKPVNINVRIIAATNKNLEEGMREGSFREDLYYRVNVIPIFLPPLKERREDIPLLVEHFLKKHQVRGIKKMSPEAMEILMNYDWPGNIRQLESVVERAILLGEKEDIIIPEDLPHEVRGIPSQADRIGQGGMSLEEVEKQLIIDALRKVNGLKTEACKLLGITYKTLLYRMQKYNIHF